jgi:hypothetical protein
LEGEETSKGTVEHWRRKVTWRDGESMIMKRRVYMRVAEQCGNGSHD